MSPVGKMTEHEIGEDKDWDKVDVGNDLYLKQGSVKVKFRQDNPIQWEDRWNRQVWKFPVSMDGHDRDLVVSSKRLLQDLAKFKPLKGKELVIYSVGEGTAVWGWVWEPHVEAGG